MNGYTFPSLLKLTTSPAVPVVHKVKLLDGLTAATAAAILVFTSLGCGNNKAPVPPVSVLALNSAVVAASTIPATVSLALGTGVLTHLASHCTVYQLYE